MVCKDAVVLDKESCPVGQRVPEPQAQLSNARGRLSDPLGQLDWQEGNSVVPLVARSGDVLQWQVIGRLPSTKCQSCQRAAAALSSASL